LIPAEFHFLRPAWLWALPLAALAVLALARRRLAPGSWQGVVDAALAPYVLATKPGGGGAYRWWLLLLGGVLAIVALAGPSWQRIEQPVYRSEQALVVALDLSRSMDAQDLSPSRVTRARLKILDILERRGSGQTALLVYSANAFTVTPLTTDADTVAALVNSLSTDIMPSRGSYPVAAIEKGRQLLEQAGVSYGEVLLITDGGTSPAAERAAEELRDAGYTLSVLGVGTPQGAPIPRAGGGFVTDRAGNMAVPRLEAAGLTQLAAAGGGRYTTLTADDSDVDRLLAGEVGDAAARGDESHSTDQWREEGPWLLLLLVPLAALAFRRGWVLVLVAALLPVAEPARAFSWHDLWQTPDQQARAALADGDAGKAAELFEDPRWKAVAKYRAGDYPTSADGFAGGGDADALYNLGNALARMGKLEQAVQSYDEALELAPGDEDTMYNRKLVADLLEQQDAENQGRNNKSSNDESGGGAQQSEGDSQSEQSGEQGDAGNAGDESQDADTTREQQEMSEEDLAALQEELQRAAEEAARQEQPGDPQEGQAQADQEARRQQEQQQAMEQWLRRIPNDPGGLLRRKFRYQYQRQGRDQDGNNLWPDNEVQPW